jgi:hypothetical protein
VCSCTLISRRVCLERWQLIRSILTRRQNGCLETIVQRLNGGTMLSRRPQALSRKNTLPCLRQPGQSHHCRRRTERRLPTLLRRRYHIPRSRCTLLKGIDLPSSVTLLNPPSLRHECTAARLLQRMGLRVPAVLRITESGDSSSSNSLKSTSKPTGDIGTTPLRM